MVIVDKQTDGYLAMTSIDNAKSYATEKNLTAAVTKVFGDDVKYMIVRNREGRWCALFPYSWNPELNVGAIIHNGFMVIG
jgi:hypothetical protein